MRFDNLNERKLHDRHQNLVDDAMETVKSSKELRMKWRACFPAHEEIDQVFLLL